MLSAFLLVTWFLSVLPAIFVLFHFLEERDNAKDGIAVCTALIVIGPITTIGFVLWALYRSARVLFGLLPRAEKTSSNSKENTSS